MGAVVEENWLSDCRRISGKTSHKERMADNDDLVTIGLPLVCGKQPADCRAGAEHFKQAAR